MFMRFISLSEIEMLENMIDSNSAESKLILSLNLIYLLYYLSIYNS